MALTLSASTFQRGTAFQVAVLGAADRSRVVAFSSDGESLTTRPLFILGDDRHNFQVGWLLTGTYRATGTPTISLVEYPFNSTTGTTSAVAATVQAGAVTPTVALATFPYTGMGPFYAYVQDAPSATVAVNAFSSDGISVRAYPAFFAGTNRTTVGYVLMGVLRFGGSPTINVLMRDRQGTNTSAIGLSLGGGGGTATAPAAPVIAVTAGNAQNSIAWTDGSDGGSAITARKLYRSTTSGFTPGPGNLIVTSPTFPYADTGLTNGTTYYYKGIATNAIGDSAASTEQSGAPAAVGTPWQFPLVFTNGSLPVSLNQTQASGSYGTNYSQATFENTGTNYYVATTGNDTTGDGLSTGTAWRTIQKAVDTVAAGSKINVGAGRFPNFVVASKNLSIYGVAGSTFVGDLLAEADITWGTLTSGRQTATLASSTVSGFVDLTLTRRSHPTLGAIPQVSLTTTTAAAIATNQGSGLPGVFRSTPSQVGAGDARSLTGKADTELLVWKTTAAAPMAISGTTQLFVKGITFAGGAEVPIGVGTRLVTDTCRFLGATDQSISSNGSTTVAATSVFYRTIVRGCGVLNADIIDYGSAGISIACEVELWVDQCGQTGADNASTQHNGVTLRANSTYLDASRAVNDLAQLGLTVGCTMQAANLSTAFTMGSQTSGDLHVAGLAFLPTIGDDVAFQQGAGLVLRIFDYDGSLTGKKFGAVTNITVTDRSGSRPATTVAVTFDPSSISTLFQDTAGTVAVTAAGDPVLRINSTQSASEYMTVVAGSYTYQTSGGLSWLQSTGTNTQRMSFVLTNTYLDDNAHFLLGVKSSDTSGILMGTGGTNAFGDYRSTGNLTAASTIAVGKKPGSPTYTVDSGPTLYTTAAPYRTAGFNNAPHVLTIKNVDLGYADWLRASSVLNTFDGNWYYLEIIRATDNTALRARETIVAAKTGATLL